MDNFSANLKEFNAQFPTENTCREYLFHLRWGDDFHCPYCNCEGYCKMGKWIYACKSCEKKTSPTSGTIFQDTKIPIQKLFLAVWLMVSRDNSGISAKNMQRILELGSYQTAFNLMHKLRKLMVDQETEKFSGRILIIETYIGKKPQYKRMKDGERKEIQRGNKEHNKTIVRIAVENTSNEIFWEDDTEQNSKIRLEATQNPTPDNLYGFIKRNADMKSNFTIYLAKKYPFKRYSHKRFFVFGTVRTKGQYVSNDHNHVISTDFTNWLDDNFHNAFNLKNLKFYLDEYAFKFNHRKMATIDIFNLFFQKAINRFSHSDS